MLFRSLSRAGSGDLDGDGVSDLFEFQTGSDPGDPASRFIAEIARAEKGPGVAIRWIAVPGFSYRVQFTPKFDSSEWQDLHGGAILGRNGVCLDPRPVIGQSYYRILTQRQ